MRKEKQKTKNRLRARENATGWAFVMPVLIVFITMTAFPFIFSLFLSFTDWNMKAFTKWNFFSGWENVKFTAFVLIVQKTSSILTRRTSSVTVPPSGICVPEHMTLAALMATANASRSGAGSPS